MVNSAFSNVDSHSFQDGMFCFFNRFTYSVYACEVLAVGKIFTSLTFDSNRVRIKRHAGILACKTGSGQPFAPARRVDNSASERCRVSLAKISHQGSRKGGFNRALPSQHRGR